MGKNMSCFDPKAKLPDNEDARRQSIQNKPEK